MHIFKNESIYVKSNHTAHSTHIIEYILTKDATFKFFC